MTREITSDTKSTLGELMKKYPRVIPTPLDQAVTRIWVFTPEQGRHLREGQAPEYLEADLVVGATSSIVTYIGKNLAIMKCNSCRNYKKISTQQALQNNGA